MSILTNPVTLGAQIGTAPGAHGAQDYVGLCYATSSTSSSGSEATGGVFQVGLTPSTSSPQADVLCLADSSTTIALSCDNQVATTPTYGTGPGDTITVSIPFVVCVDVCVSGTVGVNETGLIVGSIGACANSPPSVEECLQLNQFTLCVDGVPVATAGDAEVGAGINPGAFSDDLYGGEPCVLGVCPPLSGYIATTG